MSTPPSDAELAELRAQAAAAAAEAAQAKAEAAAAALAAAEARAAQGTADADPNATAEAEPEAPPEAAPDAALEAAPEATPQGTPEAAPEPPLDATADTTSLDAELSEHAASVRNGYTFPGARLDLGALVEDGTPVPAASVGIPLGMMNRHGLVAGATGTGKTRTLQLMTEQLSAAGVPVFVADIKGDLSGMAIPGEASEKLLARTSKLGQDWQGKDFPVEFYALGGLGIGTPIRTTITDFGPLLLSKVLGLNQTQESSLALIFHWADTQGLALLDLKDLRSVISYLTSDEGKAELKGIGGLSVATAGVILRELVSLEAQGGDVFFGEPAFETAELVKLAADGRGVISALELPNVQDRPQLFSTFLMWLLADLFGSLPEVGDPEKPKLVFFFDEAHLLFNGASKDFLNQIVQTVRLIRSKGVGVFFVTQTPKDVPGDVLAQLGARVQHALRAFTPQDAKVLRATAETFPVSDYDIAEVLTALGTGEAIVTVLSEKGAPTPVAWTRLYAPLGSMGPMPEAAMRMQVSASPQYTKYAEAIDNVSAYERLTERIAAEQAAAEQAKLAEQFAKEAEAEEKRRAREMEKLRAQQERQREREEAARKRRTEAGVNSALRSIGSTLGREITRSIFGTRRRR